MYLYYTQIHTSHSLGLVLTVVRLLELTHLSPSDSVKVGLESVQSEPSVSFNDWIFDYK